MWGADCEVIPRCQALNLQFESTVLVLPSFLVWMVGKLKCVCMLSLMTPDNISTASLVGIGGEIIGFK